MGTWGHDAFSNDDALDWLAELETSKGTSILKRPIARTLFVSRFNRVLPFANKTRVFQIISYLLSQDAVTYAAAEAVAALGGRPNADFPQLTTPWIEANRSYYNRTMAKRAFLAMVVVRDQSELRQLHDESQSPDPWLAGVDNLLDRLTQIKDA